MYDYTVFIFKLSRIRKLVCSLTMRLWKYIKFWTMVKQNVHINVNVLVRDILILQVNKCLIMVIKIRTLTKVDAIF